MPTSEAVTVPSVTMMTSTVSEESLARDRQRDRQTDTHAHTHARTHTRTHVRTHARTNTQHALTALIYIINIHGQE